MRIFEITVYTDSLLTALNRLVPQLSTEAKISRKELENILASNNSRLFVSVNDKGKITGTFTLVSYRIPTGRKVRIEDVVVEESERGKGTGEALIRFAIDLAKREGYKSLALTSRPARLAANKLYRKLGFELRETNVYKKRLMES